MFVLRAEKDAMALAEPARKVIQGIDSELPVSQVRTMETVVRQTFASQQFSAVLLGGFSLASLLLAAIGVYGVLAYSVTQRTREIGVRIALGAEPLTITRMVVASGARMVMIGAAAGLAAALALSGLDEEPAVWDWPARSADVCRGACGFCGGGAGGSLCAGTTGGKGFAHGGAEGGVGFCFNPERSEGAL